MESKIYINKRSRLEILRPVIQSWLHVLDDYIVLAPGDLPYDYAEPSQVAFLAAAAWKAGWAALEEWPIQRLSAKTLSYGRNDLWIGRPTGKGKQMTEWFIEAKRGKHTVRGERYQSEDIIKILENLPEADVPYAMRTGIKKERRLSRKKMIVVLFITLFWKGDRDGEPFQKAQNDWINACKDCSMFAYASATHITPPTGAIRSQKITAIGCSMFLKAHA